MLSTRHLLRYNCLDAGATSIVRGKSVHWLKGRVTYPIVMNKFICLSVYITLHVVTENIIVYWRDDGNKRIIYISRDVAFLYLYPSRFDISRALFRVTTN